MKKLVYITAALLVFNSCTERMEIDLKDGQEKIAIDAMIDNEAGIDTVFISKTTNFFDGNGQNIITGASVQLSYNGTTIEFKEGTKEGAYLSPINFIAEPGVTYTLKVSVDGSDYIATETAAAIVPIDSLHLLFADGFSEGANEEFGKDADSTFTVYVSFTDPIDERNYYFYEYQTVDDTAGFDNLADYANYTDDVFFNGEEVLGFPIGWLQTKSTDTIFVKQSTLTKQAFSIWNALVTETAFKGGFFDAPPSNIPSNFDNGAAGLFMVKSVHKTKGVASDFILDLEF